MEDPLEDPDPYFADTEIRHEVSVQCGVCARRYANRTPTTIAVAGFSSGRWRLWELRRDSRVVKKRRLSSEGTIPANFQSTGSGTVDRSVMLREPLRGKRERPQLVFAQEEIRQLPDAPRKGAQLECRECGARPRVRRAKVLREAREAWSAGKRSILLDC